MAGSLRDDVERWLVHEGRTFQDAESAENTFEIKISHVGAFGNSTHVFEPKKQPGILVIGAKVPLRDGQMFRYQNMLPGEKSSMEDRIADFCRSVGAVHRITREDGKVKVGVYVVLDGSGGTGRPNQGLFSDGLRRVADMGDRTSQFLAKAF